MLYVCEIVREKNYQLDKDIKGKMGNFWLQ